MIGYCDVQQSIDGWKDFATDSEGEMGTLSINEYNQFK
jgi:hypothetical protein